MSERVTWIKLYFLNFFTIGYTQWYTDVLYGSTFLHIVTKKKNYFLNFFIEFSKRFIFFRDSYAVLENLTHFFSKRVSNHNSTTLKVKTHKKLILSLYSFFGLIILMFLHFMLFLPNQLSFLGDWKFDPLHFLAFLYSTPWLWFLLNIFHQPYFPPFTWSYF